MGPVTAIIKNGKITDLTPTKKDSDLAGLRVLSSLIEVDKRYTILTEIGIGVKYAAASAFLLGAKARQWLFPNLGSLYSI